MLEFFQNSVGPDPFCGPLVLRHGLWGSGCRHRPVGLPSGPRRTNAFVQKIYALAEGEETDKNLDETYLLGKTTLLEELEVKHPGLIEKSGVLPLWAARFKRKPNSSDLNRLDAQREPTGSSTTASWGSWITRTSTKPFPTSWRTPGWRLWPGNATGWTSTVPKRRPSCQTDFNRLRELAGDPLWQARFFCPAHSAELLPIPAVTG
jgi:hypothetical protein